MHGGNVMAKSNLRISCGASLRMPGMPHRIVIAALLLWSPSPALAFLMDSVNALNAAISAIEAELETLPKTLPNATPWTIGYAATRRTGDRPEMIEIRFQQTAPIDLVVLMPATYKNDENELQALAFPERFLIERILPDSSTDIIADFRETDYPTPGIEPQLFPCPDARPTTGIRITATRLATHKIWWAEPYAIALSEVFAFSGDRNVALNAKVEVRDPKVFGYVLTPDTLVDGFSLFSHMNREVRDPLLDFHVFSDKVILDYDLGKVCRIDELRLWPVVYSTQENFPPASGTSFPTEIRLEVLEKPGGSKVAVIYQSGEDFPRPGSNPFMHRVAPVQGRYFRLTLSRGLPDFRIDRPPRIALSEFELLGNGQVLTHGKAVKVRMVGNRPEIPQQANPETLTDGRTNEGEILPLRQWIEQFKRRVVLERHLTGLHTNLEFARRQERERFGFLTYAGVALVTVLLLMVWLVRLLSERRWNRVREQIACDLHDEVGANMSSVAHSVELVRETMQAPTARQSKLLGDAIQTARLTTQETRQIVRFLEQRETGDAIPVQIDKVARLILGDIKLSCSFDETRPFQRLAPSRKWDLLLFVKEALNNVVKHAGATHVNITTQSERGRPRLVIADDGHGISTESLPPRHLESRAKRLKGRLTVDTNPETGTRITLTLGKQR